MRRTPRTSSDDDSVSMPSIGTRIWDKPSTDWALTACQRRIGSVSASEHTTSVVVFAMGAFTVRVLQVPCRNALIGVQVMKCFIGNALASGSAVAARRKSSIGKTFCRAGPRSAATNWLSLQSGRATTLVSDRATHGRLDHQ